MHFFRDCGQGDRKSPAVTRCRSPDPEETIMAKNQNTFEKRRRDMEKKMRAEDKRKKRQVRKDRANLPPEPATRISDDSDDSAQDPRIERPQLGRTP